MEALIPANKFSIVPLQSFPSRTGHSLFAIHGLADSGMLNNTCKILQTVLALCLVYVRIKHVHGCRSAVRTVSMWHNTLSMQSYRVEPVWLKWLL